MENPPPLKVLHMSPFLCFPRVPLPTPAFVISWGNVPYLTLTVGKHILIDASVCAARPNEKACWSDTKEQKADGYCIFFFFVAGLMSNLS